MKNFLTFAASVFEVPENQLSATTKFNSIPQWDSVAHLRLVMEIEAEYGVSIPMEKIGTLDSLDKFYKLLTEAKQI